jgi:hypothetical protein
MSQLALDNKKGSAIPSLAHLQDITENYLFAVSRRRSRSPRLVIAVV